MASFILTQYEIELARAAAEARVLDFTGQVLADGPMIKIRAEAIGRLLQGLTVSFGDGIDQVVTIAGPGIRLKGAEIEGVTALDDACSADGSACPPLVLEACVFKGPMALARARLRRLSLKDSKFTHLCAPGLCVDSDVDLRGVSSSEAEGTGTGADGKGLCWVEFPGATIQGSLEAGGAVLIAPPMRPDFVRKMTRPRYALSLTYARIRDNIMLEDDEKILHATGGVGIGGAEIGGGVWGRGALLVGVETSAFSARLAQVRGTISLRPKIVGGKPTSCVAKGGVDFFNAKIGGALDMDGAQLEGELLAEGVQIGANALFRCDREKGLSFRARDKVTFLGAKISGNLEMDGAQLDGLLVAESIEIGHHVFFRGCIRKSGKSHQGLAFVAKGEIKLMGAKIGGNLELSGAHLHQKLQGLNMDIGDDATFRTWKGVEGGKDYLLPFIAHKEISLSRSKITGDLDMSGACLEGALIAVSTEIGGAVLLRGEKQRPFSAKGEVKFLNADIKGNCEILNAVLGGKEGQVGRLNLVSARIMGILRILDLVASLESSASLLLTNARVGSLEDQGGEGVGDKVRLRLGGFSYDRLIAPDGAGSAPLSAARIDWLNQQYSAGALSRENASEYTPDPYERLSAYFRSAGHYEDARRIASHRLTLERKFIVSRLWRPFLWLYAVCFDYGLSPRRAIATFCAFLLLGWVGVVLADDAVAGNPLRAVLVVSTTTVTSEAAPDDAGDPGPVVPNSVRTWHDELACRDQIDPMLYAIDLFVPVLDLDQKKRCAISTIHEAWPWRLLKAVYTTFGYIVTSLTLLTVSGILRRQAEA